MTTLDDTMLDWALHYASMGWRVFPCHNAHNGACSCGKAKCAHIGKHPVATLAPHGLKDATVDEATIRRWWGARPNANIAGVPKAVFDVDIKHHEGKHGDETLKGLEALYGPLPDTVRSLTGGGGVQHFFMTDVALTSLNGLFDSIDLKAEGGYVILPPSMHESGKRYEWEIGHAPGEIEMASLPQWIVDARLRKGTKKPRTARAAKSDAPQPIHDGMRNDTLCSMAGSMRRSGFSEAAILQALLTANAEQCVPPLEDEEVRAIAHSVGQYERGQAQDDASEKEPRQTQAEILLALVRETGATFFHSETDDLYTALRVDAHTEVWPLDDRGFSDWLSGLYYRETGKPVGAEAVKQTISVLSAVARFDNPEPVSLSTRVAERGGAFWYDLTNPTWQAIEVTATGWAVRENPPILFTRYRHQTAQAMPCPGGDVRKILNHVNLKGHDTLFLCWLVCCFVPGIPHPMPILYGEKGAAKSTACTLLKAIVDPSALDTLTLQNDGRTLAVNLQQHWLLPFDNVSHINEETSDTLCRAITGGGIQQRKLYTNADDAIFTFIRCLVLNGINNVATRPDLLDRSLLIELERIPESERRELADIKSAFEVDRPAIVGGILDTLARAMGIHPCVKLDRLPRMADFARWGYAIGEALGGMGQEFLDQYAANRDSQNTEAINSDPVAMLVVAFMEKRDSWEGLVSKLLTHLKELAYEFGINPATKSFPAQPHHLSKRLRGIKSNLEAVGVEYSNEGHGRTGTKVSLRQAKSASPASQRHEPNRINAFMGDAPVTLNDGHVLASPSASPQKAL